MNRLTISIETKEGASALRHNQICLTSQAPEQQDGLGWLEKVRKSPKLKHSRSAENRAREQEERRLLKRPWEGSWGNDQNSSPLVVEFTSKMSCKQLLDTLQQLEIVNCVNTQLHGRNSII